MSQAAPSSKWLRQIDLLTRTKHSALAGLYIARYSPEPQSYVERINVARGPKRKLADQMLPCMAGGAQRNGVAIARFHPDTTVGTGAQMRGLRGRGIAAGDARKLADKSKVLLPPAQMRLGLRARYGSGMRGAAIDLRN
jgi:hypothetical protein